MKHISEVLTNVLEKIVKNLKNGQVKNGKD